MKLQLALIVVAGLMAGPAAAFSPGFEPYKKPSWGSAPPPKKPPSSYGIAPSSRDTAPRRSAPGGYAPIVGPQDPPGPRSYKGYTPGSVYAPASKAKPPCEQSLYAHACDRK
jgi:hypothetical protein